MLPCVCFFPLPAPSAPTFVFRSHKPPTPFPLEFNEEKDEEESHTTYFLREQLREQHELTQEIGNAITSMPITEPIDEDELQADLDKLEQETLDEKMLRTGTVPVADSLSNRLPAGPTGASTYLLFFIPLFSLHLQSRILTKRVFINSQRQIQSRRRRRRSRAGKTPSRNGHVKLRIFVSPARLFLTGVERSYF